MSEAIPTEVKVDAGETATVQVTAPVAADVKPSTGETLEEALVNQGEWDLFTSWVYMACTRF